ncbi:hypothetical protein ncot_08840 [Nocardioides sp. JQ2195]|uniref:FKBP-type peptidyl-prolyl cis-trans isomerase n=1 Tax=Nocardioides sp. JQ2195 TaxID=2592334 RepID=UPI00143EA541|nr:FKBP-type peptidyl-prolyl cis-trans isomerase [Nocardioides sp. JQ2195]QIX26700.1 hypothetical protein ncot_08840 [Nocardioides sp. JQ2195]
MRRVPLLLGTLLLIMAGLSACGDDTGAGTSFDGDTGKVSVAGDFGKEPKLTFDGSLSVSQTKVDVMSEGDGPTLEDGDAVFANLYIANGYTGEQAASTWDDGGRTTMIEVADNPFPAFKEALAGQHVGSRIAVQAPPEDAFGEAGNDNLAIAGSDTVVFVIDLVKKLPDSIEAGKARSPEGGPRIVEKDGTITGLKFTGKTAAINKLTTETLVDGKGPKAKDGDTLVVKYLGQVNGKNEVFDENFSDSSRFPVTLGAGGSIKGWQDGLTGVKAGSRVLLRIPAKLGYGKQGSGEKIPPNSDLVFVLDVLAINN